MNYQQNGSASKSQQFHSVTGNENCDERTVVGVPQNGELPTSGKVCHQNLQHVFAQLEMKQLWDEFHQLGTEMIVTKAGRL